MLSRLIRRPEVMLFGVRGATVGLQFITALVIAALLGTADFGIYAALWAATLVLSSIVGGGAPNYLLREIPVRDARGETRLPRLQTLSLILVRPAALSIIAFCVWSLLSPWLPEVYADRDAAMAVAAAAFSHSMLFSIATVVRVRQGPNAGMLLRDALPHLLLIAGALGGREVGAAAPRTVIVIFAGAAFLAALAAAGLLVVLRRLALDAAARRYDGSPASYWATMILSTVTTNLDVVLAGAFLGDTATGIYAIAKRVTNFVTFPQIVANWTVAARIAATFATGDRAGLTGAIRQGALVTFPPALVIGAMILLATPLWAAVFGIDATGQVWRLAGLLALANLVMVWFGVQFMVMSQCGLEALAVAARITGAAVLAVGAMAAGMVGWLDPARLAAIMVASRLATHGIAWRQVCSRLKLDTSAMVALPGRRHATAADVTARGPE